ncbi:TraR/DksA family transcriptional regulator [Halobacillus naozhouensis]|uniref:TraR/DksA C4-type zinc finger protein n=1 Tax=Halobacillus naozhouensis TaxID=554880 RepID=A0ABY8IYE3_9BACI|nr:TraR/DksA C4-type zinc finger protein [Halobacillus naozhouensis]WFT73565.1 TraR/DksA C4-type zinc finger protein [Halobacillus naozhouensis]
MLTDKQLNEFKQQLEAMKEEAEQELAKFQNQQKNSEDPNDKEGELSSVADHPGDLGTSQFEKEKEYTLHEQTREKLKEIYAALDRIKDGSYGKSEKSGEPIPLERLKAMPTARMTVEEAEST